MKKKFKMENLDCANCAAKMEAAIKKIPGVLDANMNFMTQKMTLEAEDEKLEAVLAEAQKCCDRVDKGCRILIEN